MQPFVAQALFFFSGIARKPKLETVGEVAPCILSTVCVSVPLYGVDRKIVDCVRAGGTGQGVFQG